LGAVSSWSYYLTADECAADASALVGKPVRVSGRVAADSLDIAEDRTRADFLLQGSEGTLQVQSAGPIPDNLAEGIEVLVEGRLEESGCLQGDRVITRCASKYESKKLAEQTAYRTDQEIQR
jgi:cytochrome c-type biogenesis protein CcmE